jgi:hypothetical protein
MGLAFLGCGTRRIIPETMDAMLNDPDGTIDEHDDGDGGVGRGAGAGAGREVTIGAR